MPGPRRGHLRLRRSAAAAAFVALLTTAGCGADQSGDDASDGSPSNESSPSRSESRSTPSKEARDEAPEPDLSITVKGDEVGPNAAALDATVGEPLLLEIRADRAGELHVHSKPEQYVEFRNGVTRQELVIETPGVVEIEEHDTEAVVAQVQVTG